MNKVEYKDWKLVDYKVSWDRQSGLHQDLVQAKKQNVPLAHQGYFILCEHPAVYTLGKSGSEDHLLVNAEQRKDQDIQFYKINRGGDITHHGPGQLVGYPILDLEYWYRDVHRYVRNIEEVIIRLLAKYQIKGFRINDFTGVWTEHESGEQRKICAIGVHLSRWVSMHGFALNVNNDLKLFEHIVPCGIQEVGKSITSMAEILGSDIDFLQLKQEISTTFAEVFECDIE